MSHIDPDLVGIVPIIPFYCRDGNIVIKRWSEDFVGKSGESATVHKLIYQNKKGKLSEHITYRVEWK